MEPRRRPQTVRRRPRRGSLERPINGRAVRGTLLLVALPLLVASFTVARPEALPAPELPPRFDGQSAGALAAELASEHPDRSPGSSGAIGAARWFSEQLSLFGFRTRSDVWREHVPGLGDVQLRNLVAVVPGRSTDAIVVLAHRDTTGTDPGANDNASGTAALIELARGFAASDTTAGRARPRHTLVLVSTDGGAFGGLGAERFAHTSPYRGRLLAVVALRALASPARPRLVIAGDAPLSPAAALVRTAAVRVLERSGDEPERPGALRQLVDLGYPVVLAEQAAFVAQGVPAVTLTTAGDRPPPAFGDTVERLAEPAAARRLQELGSATDALIGSLDSGLSLAGGDSSYLYLGERVVRGWSIQLVLVCLLAPFFVGAVDLFARLRRRRIPLVPAVRSLQVRLGFWAFVGLILVATTVVGLFPTEPSRPVSPATDAAHAWPVAGLAVAGVLTAASWLLFRERLLPRRTVGLEEQLAGYSVGLLGLGVVALTVAAVNPYALIFVLPSLYAWLWLPQLAMRAAWSRVMLFALGLSGPLLGLIGLARRYDLGVDVLPYALRLATTGYTAPATVVLVLAWAAAAGQLGALSVGRYTPYPDAAERPRRGLLRRFTGVLAAARRGRGAAPARDTATG